MRTLLVSFVLVSLAQLATADPQIKIGPDYFASCGIYTCYVPEFCTNNKPLATSRVKQVADGDPSFDNCPAIIRFHLYADYHAIVEVEGLLDTTKSIKLEQKKKLGTTSTTFADFSCEQMPKPPATATELSAKYGQQTPKIIPYDGASKMKCVFEVKLKSTEKIFLSADYWMQFTIDDVSTKIDNVDSPPSIPTVSCDPTKLNFNDDLMDPRKIYEEVKYDLFTPRKYECSSSVFKMEYRTGGKYEEVTMEGVDKYKMTCSGSKFLTNENELDDQEDISIRCAADANLFCKTSLKSNPTTTQEDPKSKPNFVPPNLNPRTASSLKCPSNAPHLIIMDGVDERQIKNPQFECLNNGGTAQWTLNEETFTEEGPEVYCTAKVKCLDTIPESSVIDGELDKDFFPTCPGGTLYANKVDKNNVGAKVTNTECDDTIGEYKYTTADGTKHEVVASTKFICDYPVIENFEQREKQTETIIKGSIYGVVAAVIGGIIVIAALSIYTIYKTKKNWKKQRALDMKLWNRYCLDEDEEKDYYDKKEKRNAQNAKKGLPQNEEMTAPAEACNWSKFLMSAQYRALAQVAPNGQELLKADVKISNEDTVDFDPDDEANVGKATLYYISYSNERPTTVGDTEYFKLLKKLGWETKFDKEIKDDITENHMKRKKIQFIEDQKKEGKAEKEPKKESEDQEKE